MHEPSMRRAKEHLIRIAVALARQAAAEDDEAMLRKGRLNARCSVRSLQQ
jgi:hypothetical protein